MWVNIRIVGSLIPDFVNKVLALDNDKINNWKCFSKNLWTILRCAHILTYIHSLWNIETKKNPSISVSFNQTFVNEWWFLIYGY